MADLEIEVLTNEKATITGSVVGALDLEIELDNATSSSSLVTEVAVVEVTLPTRLDLVDQVNNEGSVPGFALLNAGVDPATLNPPIPAGTIILRRG